MARIDSDYDIAGRYGNLVVYKVGDQLYARTKSSLTGKSFWRNKAFARSREKAVQFGQAARLAKVIYASLPKEVKCHGVFGKVTGFVHKGLQEGKRREDIVKAVLEHLGLIPPPVAAINEESPAMPSKSKKQLPVLSQWQVTVAGRLQPADISLLLFKQQCFEVAAQLAIPDG